MKTTGKAVVQTTTLAIVSAFLYFLLYYFSVPIMNWSQQGGWYFLIPVVIAFIFSFVYGTFANHFWDMLGIKAKPVKK
ncbi:hypothetical protein QUF74_15955 [Candidatus Halobeggiatoa sp. HSG11]|nr:hypothetical protein [Candidatus Halobeggiatoa sp. HSG11]